VTDRLAPLPPQPAGVPWPTVEWDEAEPAVADPGLLRDLVEEMFVDPAPEELGHTHALVVVHRGRVVAERYGRRFVSEFEELAGIEADDITVDTKHISWSMAKSILHSVVGTLAIDGRLSLDEAPPVPAWSSPGDPRAAITWDHLLQMRSGLQWVEEYYDFGAEGVPDVVTMLYGDERADMAGFAAGFPLVQEPGSPEAYNYSSGASNIVSAAAGSLIGGGEDGMRLWLEERLFAAIGMASATPSFDEAGTFVASSYVDATARDFARFGLLALRDGVWDGQRLLPEGWMDHGRAPRSPDDHFTHGAHWWARPDGRWGMFLADGFEGQRIYVVPELDLVLVRLGKTHTDHSPTMDAHLTRIVELFEGR
jgi:CubicO group peptidase (beta-lactamase class C family)